MDEAALVQRRGKLHAQLKASRAAVSPCATPLAPSICISQENQSRDIQKETQELENKYLALPLYGLCKATQHKKGMQSHDSRHLGWWRDAFAAPCPGRRQLSPAVQADQGYAEAKQVSREARLAVLREAEVVVSTLIAAGGDLLSLSAGQPGFDAIIIDEVCLPMQICTFNHNSAS